MSEKWVRDEPKVRGYHGKTLRIEGRGNFIMTVRETGDDGKPNPGFVQVLITPIVLEPPPQSRVVADSTNDEVEHE